MGHYASEMGYGVRKVTCPDCGETGDLSEALIGGLHPTTSDCIKHLLERIKKLEAKQLQLTLDNKPT